MKKFSEKSFGKKNKLIIAAAVITAIAVAVLSGAFSERIYYRLFPGTLEYDNTLTVLNVGQAKCTLIETDGKCILIDCGSDGETENIPEYLKSRNIKKIDLIVLTHFHYDHTSDFTSLTRNFKIGMVIIPNLSEENTPQTAFYRKLIENGENGDYRIEKAAEGNEYSIGECVVRVLSDTMNMTSDETQDEDKRINNTSVCISVNCGDFSYLETGDAEIEVEENIADAVPDSITLFNASHHGSSDSNSERFLKKVNPEYVTVSCSKDNEYSHPSKAFTDRINRLDIKMLITFEYGNVVFSMTENKLIEIH